MLTIVGVLGFLIFSFKSIRLVNQEAEIYREFQQSKLLPFLLLLFPAGPAALLVLPLFIDWPYAVAVAVICFLPALILSRKHIAVFDCSGTSRTDGALNSA